MIDDGDVIRTDILNILNEKVYMFGNMLQHDLWVEANQPTPEKDLRKLMNKGNTTDADVSTFKRMRLKRGTKEDQSNNCESQTLMMTSSKHKKDDENSQSGKPFPKSADPSTNKRNEKQKGVYSEASNEPTPYYGRLYLQVISKKVKRPKIILIEEFDMTEESEPEKSEM